MYSVTKWMENWSIVFALAAFVPSSPAQIAFCSNRDGNFEIYVMDANGNKPVNLTRHPGDDFAPAWSPDGTKIAFWAIRDGKQEIYVMNTDGSNPVRLTNDLAQDVTPAWSQDVTQIAFGSMRNGNMDVYVMNADGCCRVIWHLGYTTSKSVSAFAADYGEFKQVALAIAPSYQAKGILTDGFNSTKKSLSQLFPTAQIANCMLHATFKLPAQIKGVTKAVRQKLNEQFRQIFFVNNVRKTPNHRSLGQRLRRFTEQVTHLAGEENGQRVRRWIERKKAGWHVLFADASIPKTTTKVDQFHNAMDRKLFMMKGFHHEQGSQRVFLNGLAILANLIPYQRLAINAGKCAVEVEDGKVPTKDWFLNLQILTSGGFQ
ncbi:PD40 domain-containing protein [Candidatus Poribacteria bacterium]|nr:PD40 domain-containing protein [Candidatus Poribacteria bacterium]